MKQINFLLLIFLVLHINLFAQKIDSTQIQINKVNNYLMSLKNNTNPDQIFVQTDRNLYKAGDTIFFHSYIRNKITQKFITSSISMYSLLYNVENELVDSARFKIDGSTASGWLIIPTNSKSGRYLFTAFTSAMQNFETKEAFHLDLMVNSNLQNAVKTSILAKTDNYFDLKFLPEGGTFIDEFDQKMGFNAVNKNGEPVYFEGLLKNKKGRILDTIRSGSYGPGSFICTPQAGLYVELINGNYANKIWPLPQPSNSGMSLQVAPRDKETLEVTVQSTSFDCKSGYVLGVMNMATVFNQSLTSEQMQRFVVKTNELPKDVMQISLFDKNSQPIANRLVYVNVDKHLNFNISTNAAHYIPGQETELTISATNAQGKPETGVFSIAVVDSASGNDVKVFVPEIGYTLDHQANFLNNLPHKVLEAGFENITNEERDLLLMVYGWSSIHWDFNRKTLDKKELINYDLLKMKILASQNKILENQKLDLVSLEGISKIHLSTNNLGELSFPFDSLFKETKTVILMPTIQDKNRVLGAQLSIPFNEQYFANCKLFAATQNRFSELNINNTSNYNKSMTENTRNISEVTITGNSENQKEIKNDYEKKYQNMFVKSVDYKDIRTTTTMVDLMRRFMTPYKLTSTSIILRRSRSFLGPEVPALFVLDGLPLYTGGWAQAKMLIPSDISSISVLDGTQAFTSYGEAAQGGVIFINTVINDPKTGKNQKEKMQHLANNNMMQPYSIYRPYIEYYNPTKSEIDLNPTYQNRQTIYWNAEVFFDGKSPVKIKFPNLKHTGTVIITINGVSINNLSGSGKASYSVQKK